MNNACLTLASLDSAGGDAALMPPPKLPKSTESGVTYRPCVACGREEISSSFLLYASSVWTTLLL